MRKKVLYGLLIFTMIFAFSACSSKEENKEKEKEREEEKAMEPNMKLGKLWFYVPKDKFTYRADLRGLIYSEDEKKVFIKGDYENDPDNVISLVVYTTNVGMGANQYAEQINNKLSDKDVKYTIKKNSKIIELYARENYVISGKVNYAYIVDNAGLVYVVNIVGPNANKDEIAKLAKDVHSSLLFN